MKHYIDKDAVVAAIKKRLLPAIRDKHYDEWEEGQDSERIAILGILDNLEVKEVDLEKELKEDWLFANKTEVDCLESMCLTEDMFVSLAKKYFQLGLEAAQKGK